MSLAKEIVRRLNKFAADLRSGKPIKATRVERKDGKVTRRTVWL